MLIWPVGQIQWKRKTKALNRESIKAIKVNFFSFFFPKKSSFNCHKTLKIPLKNILLKIFALVLEKVRSKRQKHVVVVDSDGSEIEDENQEEEEEEARIEAAVEYKDQGNEHFKNGNYQEAAQCYTMAQESGTHFFK